MFTPMAYPRFEPRPSGVEEDDSTNHAIGRPVNIITVRKSKKGKPGMILIFSANIMRKHGLAWLQTPSARNSERSEDEHHFYSRNPN